MRTWKVKQILEKVWHRFVCQELKFGLYGVDNLKKFFWSAINRILFFILFCFACCSHHRTSLHGFQQDVQSRRNFPHGLQNPVLLPGKRMTRWNIFSKIPKKGFQRSSYCRKVKPDSVGLFMTHFQRVDFWKGPDSIVGVVARLSRQKENPVCRLSACEAA